MTSLPPPPPGIRSMDSRYYVTNQKTEGNALNPYINHYSSAETLFTPRLLGTLSSTAVSQSYHRNTEDTLSSPVTSVTNHSPSLLSSPITLDTTNTRTMLRIQQDAMEHDIMQTVETLGRPARDHDLLSSLSSLNDIMDQLKHRYSSKDDEHKAEGNEERNDTNPGTTDTIYPSLSSSSTEEVTTYGSASFAGDGSNYRRGNHTTTSSVSSSIHYVRESILPHSNAVDKISRMGNAPVPSRLIVTDTTSTLHTHPSSSTFSSLIPSGATTNPSHAQSRTTTAVSGTTGILFPSSSSSSSNDHTYDLPPLSTLSLPTTLPASSVQSIPIPSSSSDNVDTVEASLISPPSMSIENLSIPVLPEPLYLNGNDIATTLRLNNVLETCMTELRRLITLVTKGSDFIYIYRNSVHNNHSSKEERYRIHLIVQNDLRTLSWIFTDGSNVPESFRNGTHPTTDRSLSLPRIQKCTLDGQALRWTIDYVNTNNSLAQLELIAPDRVIVQDWLNAIKTLWEINNQG